MDLPHQSGNSNAQRKHNPPAGAVLLLTLAMLTTACQRRSETTPNIEALKGVLEKSAAEQLAAPTMTDDSIILREPQVERDTRAAQVVELASEAGGAAIRTDHENGDVQFLIRLPARAASGFVRKLTGNPPKTADDPPADETIWLDVLLTDPE